MRAPLVAVAAAVAALLLAGVDAHADPSPTATDEVVTSYDGTPIALTVFRPAGADRAHRVPVVLHSHGWAGSRRKRADDRTVAAFLADGYGVASFDQRGHGDSGGQANVQDPDLEVRDTEAVIDRIASLDWVQLERPGDPVLGAIGGSYGGGYQTMTALAEQASRPGGTRFDALAPQITWFDLPDSLAPSDVPRSEWLAALYASGARMLPPYIHEAFAQGMATGTLPTSLKAEFATHSPRWFTDRGVRLDIPVLFRQGTSDNLFDLNQGLRNFDSMLTRSARARSRFVAYNGGHALPALLPTGDLAASVVRQPEEDVSPSDPTSAFTSGGDACSGEGGFLARTIEFFDAALRHRGATSFRTAYSLTTADGASCLRLDSLPAPVEVPAARTITTSSAGAPQLVPLHTGPLTVAGVPVLRASVTTVVPDTRVFLGLAVGTSPADARLVQNNVLPLRVVDPASGAAKAAELPGVAVVVPEGQTLFLVVTPVADAFGAHGSRAPGAMVLDDVVVELPVVPS